MFLYRTEPEIQHIRSECDHLIALANEARRLAKMEKKKVLDSEQLEQLRQKKAAKLQEKQRREANQVKLQKEEEERRQRKAAKKAARKLVVENGAYYTQFQTNDKCLLLFRIFICIIS